MLDEFLSPLADAWVKAVRAAEQREDARVPEDAAEGEITQDEIGSVALLEISERAYDRLLLRLNALDALLVGILLAALAIGGIAVDKDRGDLWWLLPAYLVSAAGLIIGNIARRPPDPNPVDAVTSLVLKGEAGLKHLIEHLGDNWETYQRLQPWKMGLVFAALILLTLGTVGVFTQNGEDKNHEGQSRRPQSQASQGVAGDGRSWPILPEEVWDLRGANAGTRLFLRGSPHGPAACSAKAQIACLPSPEVSPPQH